jgi:hypothetical protein
VLLVAIAVVKTQLTAQVLRLSTSSYPTAYSLWSCVVVCIMLLPVFALEYIFLGKKMQFPTMKMAPTLFLIILFTSLDLGFTNIALAEISTALQQCIAATNPFHTIFIETALYQKWQHVLTYSTVTLLVFGAVLTSMGTIDQMTTFGVISACIAVVSSASKYVFTHSAFRHFKKDLSAMSLLFWVDLLMVPIYLVWTMIPTQTHPHGELFPMFQDTFSTLGSFSLFTATAALGGVRALTQYIVLGLVSATSMSTANIFTQALNMIISIPLQGLSINAPLCAGIGTILASSGFYAYIKSNKTFLPWVDEKICGVSPPAAKASHGSSAS